MKNIVLLTIDTLRQDVLGIYGNPRGLSPFIDSLSNNCLVFTEAHAVGPYTQTSFPGILTSSFYFDYGKSTHLSPQRLLISEPLRRAGIVTAAFHSNPYLSEYFGWNRGWNVFYDSMEEEVSDKVPYVNGEAINRKVNGWLSSHLTGKDYQRFFLWVHFMDIHEPYIPDSEYLKMVSPAARYSEDEMFLLFKEVLLKRDVSDTKRVEILRTLYEAKVREVDDHVRYFFGILEESGILRDSIVIITSDHGDEFNEHAGLSHDGKMYQELIRVPLVIFDPEREEREECNKIVSSIDIPPTILHTFDLPQEETFQGQPLLPIDDYRGRACFGEAIEKLGHKIKETDKEIYYYREGNFKIIYRGNTDTWEMYDLHDDQGELKNVANIAPEWERMRSILQGRIDRLNDKRADIGSNL